MPLLSPFPCRPKVSRPKATAFVAGAFTALAMAVVTPQGHAATLSDNLSSVSTNTQTFGSPSGTGDTEWLAQAFTTTATDYILTSVSAIISNQNSGTTGNYIFSIFDTGSGGVPGVNLGDILTNPISGLGGTASTISTTTSPVLALSPSTNYYLVLRTTGATDGLEWYTAPNGSGTGFPSNYSLSTDGGSTWSTPDSTGDALVMKILAEGPPPPVSGPLPLFGAAAAFGYSRRMRKRISGN